MLEKFVIFSRTGVVLFSIAWTPLKTDPLGALVKDVLLPQRPGSQFDVGDYRLKWTVAVAEDLVFVAVLDKAIAAKIKYVDTLLATVRAVFTEKTKGRLGDLPVVATPASMADVIAAAEDPIVEADLFAFAPIFEECLRRSESNAAAGGKAGAASGGAGSARSTLRTDSEPSASASASRAGTATGDDSRLDSDDDGIDADHYERTGVVTTASAGGSGRGAGLARTASASSAASGAGVPRTPSADAAAAADGDTDAAAIAEARARLKTRVGSAKSVKGAGSPATGKPGALGSGQKPPSLSALLPADFKHTKELERSLDARRSASGGDGSAGGGDDDDGSAGVEKVTYTLDGTSKSGTNLDDSDDDLISTALAGAAAASGGAGTTSAGAASGGVASSVSSWFSRSSVGTFLSKLTGNKTIDAEDLKPVMEALKAHLVDKNVTTEIADHLVTKVGESLIGRKLDLTASVMTTVSSALKDAIHQILTPRRSVDVLAEVRAKKEAGDGPYVIVFVGVNGVGKSTTLSKVAYHLRENKHSVMIAACDSFRAGAVEQLKRHCTSLDVPLYSQGYGKDPVAIASAAIKEACMKGTDVVLVDTAGRMQNNAGLMGQIAKVVAVNKPDLVLFVGEALVGNDGVDQLVEFDRAMVDHAESSDAPRRLDGIVLTKFDTIDDKVGTALSMVYRTSIPIVFLGTGQKYTDLRKLNVGAVVKALMS